MSPQEKKACHQILSDFFHGKVENPVSAGINNVAKFQESLSVMRDVVLHALRIQKHQQPTMDKTRTGRKAKGKKKHLRPDENPTLPPTVGSGSVSECVSEEMVESPVSPSSHSRISSGFGSLQGEGSSDKLVVNEAWGSNDSSSSLVGTTSGARESGSVKLTQQHNRRQAWTSPILPTSADTQQSTTDVPSQLSTVVREPANDISTSPTAELNAPLSSPTSGSPYNSHNFSTQHNLSLADTMRKIPTSKGTPSVAVTQDVFSTSRKTELTQSREEEKRLQQHLHLANLQLQEQKLKYVSLF